MSATISPGGCAASGRPTSASPRARCCSIWSSAAGRQPLLEAAELPSALLPPLLASGTALGHVRPEMADATGLPADCMVGVGGHDHVCGLIAAGADATGRAARQPGHRRGAEPDQRRPARSIRRWAGTASTRAPSRSTGHSTTYSAGCRRRRPRSSGSAALFAGVDHATLIAEAEAAPAGSEGVLFLPHLRLGLAALSRPDRPRRVSRDSSAATSRGALFRAVLEGIALDGGQHAQDDAEASGHRAARAGSSRSAAAPATSS